MPGVPYINMTNVTYAWCFFYIDTWQVLLMVIAIYGMQLLRHKSSYTYGINISHSKCYLQAQQKCYLQQECHSLGLLCFIQPGIRLKINIK